MNTSNLMTLPVIARELGMAYETVHKWIVLRNVVPYSRLSERVIIVERADAAAFIADYRAGKYARWGGENTR